MSERVSDPFDTLVIGGGIAGLTAALFANAQWVCGFIRSGCSTLRVFFEAWALWLSGKEEKSYGENHYQEVDQGAATQD